MTQPYAAAASRYDFARKLALGVIAALAGFVIAVTALPGSHSIELLAFYLALKQDLPVVPIFLVAALFRPVRIALPKIDRGAIVPAVVLALIMILAVGWLGHQLVFQGGELSRDEQMAVFDQGIFSHRRLFWPVAPDWRFLADALNRRFMLPIGNREYWVSDYLPVHSAFRALVGSIVDPAFASPIMAALGALSVTAVARRLWPESSRTALVTLLLFVTSSQVVITSMTAFSMSMHLGLNLLWLWLFLKDRRETHALAAVVGFFATGIHQPLFHPLFVAPFLFLLLQQRRWRVLAFYVACYAIIGLFWLGWPIWISGHGVGTPTAIDCGSAICSSGVSFIDRLTATVTSLSLRNLWLTSANLLRFICWQHPMLLPLALFGAIACWRAEPLARALAVGFLLPVVIMGILLPWQGHGWGYRYLHPVLGNAVLLAGYGFYRLENAGLSLRRPIILSSVAALLLLPVHALMAARMAAPFAQIRKELASIPADAVIVDSDSVPFGQDVVLNRFDLTNRPKLLIASLVKPQDLPQLCSRSTIAFVDAPRLAPLAQLFSTRVPNQPSSELRALRTAATADHCRIVEPALTFPRSW